MAELFGEVVSIERVRGLQWVAIAIAGSGLVLVLQPWSMGGSALSNLLAVAGGVTWAASAALAKRMRRDHAFDLLVELDGLLLELHPEVEQRAVVVENEGFAAGCADVEADQ